MTRVDRHIFGKFLISFTGANLFLIMILLLDKLFDLANLIIEKHVPIYMVLKVFALSLPFMLALTIPMAVLVACISVYGRLVQDFEILAFASTGISLWRLMRLPLIFSIFLFFFMVYFNGFLVPEANHTLKNYLFDLYQWKPTIQLREGLFNQIDNYQIYIGRKNDKTSEIFDVKINQKTENIYRIILAERGKLKTEKDKFMILDLKDGLVQEADQENKEILRRLSFNEYEIKIPLKKEKVREVRLSRGDREMTLTHLFKNIKMLEKRLEKIEPKNKWPKIQLIRYWVEVNKKFAIPFNAIIFVLLGIPLAKRFGKGGYGTAFGVSLFVFTFYYVALVGGEEAADNGKIPAWFAMWIANIITLIGALIAIVKYR